MKIEFRWMPIKSVWEGDAYVKVGYHQDPHVLQFRYVTRLTGDEGDKYEGWTEWEDVRFSE
jgi:hypothetical protein